MYVTGLRPNGQNVIFALFRHGPLIPSEPPAYAGWVKVDKPEEAYTFQYLPYGDYALVILHDLNGNNAFDADPQTGIPTDGFSIVNLDKVEPSLSFKQPITFDQVKFQVDQPEIMIEALMGYPPFGTTGG